MASTLSKAPIAFQFDLVQTVNTNLNDGTTTIAQVYLQLGLVKSAKIKVIVERPQPVKLKSKVDPPAPFTRSILSVVRIRTDSLAPGDLADFFLVPGCELVVDFSESRSKGEIAVTGFAAVPPDL